MAELSEVAKRDIVDLFRCGVMLPGETEPRFISWHGRFEDAEFLKRLYNLQELPSYDSRYKTAEADINCHVRWQDWESDWVFSDNRFHIMDGNTEDFLNFICEVFHPAVTRNSIENEECPEYYYFQEIKKILLSDGYELYEADRKGNKPVIKWRESDASDQVLNAQVDDLRQSFSSDYMQKQIEQMQQAIKDNPTDAIGKAKELVESCCKTILEKDGTITIDPNWDVPQLGRETFRILDLLPNNYNGSTQGEETIRRLLGNLISIPHGLAELRNPYGSGHGRPNSFASLDSRHARLAVGASVTLCQFLWGTFEEMQNNVSSSN